MIRDKISSTIIQIFLILIFCLPKINLIEVDSFNAGLRIDDLLIASFAGFYLIFCAIKLKNNPIIHLSRVESIFYFFIVVTTISTTLNTVIHGRGSILFPIRLLEYFVFFYMGWLLASDGDKIRAVVSWVFWLNIIVAFAQLLELIGGFTVYGYKIDVSNRVIGLTAGPWEIGVLLNFISCYFLLNAKTQIGRYLVFGLALFIILANGSRMALLAQLAILLYYLFISGGISNTLKRLIAFAPIIIVATVFFENSSVADRSNSLISGDNFLLFAQSYHRVHATEAAPQWAQLGVLARSDIVDASWSMRGPKWIYAFKMWLINPVNTVLGVGMGVFGNALDGGWLRLLSEAGIIGFGLFLATVINAARLGPDMRLIIVAFSVNMLFIDIHIAYKIMSMLFCFVGFYSRLKK